MSSADKLTILRNSTEHVLTMAMENLYGKNIIKAMGPAIEDGFYFDFDSPKDFKLAEADFPKIEKEMHRLISLDLPISVELVSPDKAKAMFKDNPYKQELIKNILDKGDKKIRIVTIGKQGTDNYFPNICKDQHLKSTGEIKAFKLLSIAGAYWHGDEKNQMLTRVYGTAFGSKKDLDAYLENRQLAEENNHRQLGKKLELFAIFPEIGSGLPVWLPKGYTIRRILEDYMLQLEKKTGYQHILTPHISRDTLFKISGHLQFYKDSMYPPNQIDDETYYLKPMNCPAGMMVYNMKPKSYRDLPIKIGELGTVYRYEKTGELQGLQRVRGFTQNDAHIFCTKDQLEDEIQKVIEMLKIFYRDLGFDKYNFVLATSDPKQDKYKFCGQPADWAWTEKVLEKALVKNQFKFELQPGEAAFYGPKIDVLAVNVFGKADAISTIQVDFNLPEKFKLEYIDSKNQPQVPFVIHRALVGSFERFFAFLIEHYAGAFPVWLAPVQVVVIPITDQQITYAQEITKTLKNQNIRVELDDRSESMQNRIRQAETQKTPYILILGEKEVKAKSLAVRQRTKGDLGQLSLTKFLDKLQQEIDTKAIN